MPINTTGGKNRKPTNGNSATISDRVTSKYEANSLRPALDQMNCPVILGSVKKLF
jgi:hypothetical protein